ncbi:hypothetical protein [Roseibium aggregatum]|uniref:hypothetical protein n=1 Tax=Roseibium aggregatum TaxID=187304 RepID=UPI00094B38E9|nr:hypothetical protein [Roseibium aggregatum]UFI03453.1 hypothetical protein ST40_026135 [Roseibium aggregatum]
MGGKEVFHTLPPEIRAMALAGHYLQSFALMEAAMNTAIGKALKLSSVQSVVVCKNISFRDKIHILRTLVDISPIATTEKKQHDTFLNKVAGYSADRNMVAHDLFGPDESQTGIEFFVTKAKGKLHFPTVVWSVDEVEKKSKELMNAQAKLKKMCSLFVRVDLVNALLAREKQDDAQPIAGLFSLGTQILETQQNQSPPVSASQRTNQSTNPQIPEEPEE